MSKTYKSKLKIKKCPKHLANRKVKPYFMHPVLAEYIRQNNEADLY